MPEHNGNGYSPYRYGRLEERVEHIATAVDELRAAWNRHAAAHEARLARLEEGHLTVRASVRTLAKVWGFIQLLVVAVFAWWLQACAVPEPDPCREAAAVTEKWIELADALEAALTFRPRNRDEAQAFAGAIEKAVERLRETDATVRTKVAACLGHEPKLPPSGDDWEA